MTEREKKEKAIAEMTTVVPEEMKYPLDRNTTILFSVSFRKAIAKKFYDAGYRKEEEVQKETAKEILQEIASPYYAVGNGYELTRRDIQELAEKFGVEVEE